MSASAGKESGKAPPSQGVAPPSQGVAAATSNGSAPLSRKSMDTSQKRVLFQISEDSTMDDSPPQTPNNNGELSDSVFTATETGASNGSDVGNLKQKKPGSPGKDAAKSRFSALGAPHLCHLISSVMSMSPEK